MTSSVEYFELKSSLPEGWVGGWMVGWVEGKAGLRIAYSNQRTQMSNSSNMAIKILQAAILYYINSVRPIKYSRAGAG